MKHRFTARTLARAIRGKGRISFELPDIGATFGHGSGKTGSMWLSRYTPGVLVFALSGFAQASPMQGVRLSFVRADDALDCISATQLEREIARRMGGDPFSGSARQWIEGMVTRNAGVYEVQLFERDADGRTLGVRRLRESSGDCRRLDDAIELAIALIIDPSAQLAPNSPTSPAAPAGTAPVAVTPAGTSPAAVAPAAARTQREAVARATDRSSAPLTTMQSDAAARVTDPPSAPLTTTPDAASSAPNAAPSAASRQRASTHDATTTSGTMPVPRDATNPTRSLSPTPQVFVNADALIVSGVLPALAAGIEASTRVALERRNRFSLRLATLLLPEQKQTVQQSAFEGTFGYGLTAFELGLCANGSAPRLVWHGCGGAGVGAIHALVHDRPTPLEPGDRFWLAFRLDAGIALQIAGPVWLGVRVFELLAPNRWAFRVRTEQRPIEVFRQNLFMPGAALGLGLKFD